MSIAAQLAQEPELSAATADDGLSASLAASGGGGGTTDHRYLTGRDADDQHPISSIAGLSSALDEKLSGDDLAAAIEQALAEAKESGEFDGPAGPTGPTGPQGEDGAAGPAGADGTPGYSPTVAVTDITGGHRVTITDEDGPKSFDVMDGSIAEIGNSLNVGTKAIIQTIDGIRGNVQLWNESGLITVNAYTTINGRGAVDVNNSSGQSRAGIYVASDDEGKLVLKDANGNSQILHYVDIEKLHAMPTSFVGRPVLLWQGTASADAGTALTIADTGGSAGCTGLGNISDYKTLLFVHSAGVAYNIVNNDNTALLGGGNYYDVDEGYAYAFAMRATLSDNTLTITANKYLNLSHSTRKTGNAWGSFTAIYGIVKTSDIITT